MLTCWRALELDLHTVYGIDVESGILAHRTWRWLEIRILDLLKPERSTRVRAALKTLLMEG